jgi:hypothetical protein
MELVIPFRSRSKDGAVRVEYSINEDPQRWGNGLLGPAQHSTARRSAGASRSAAPPSPSRERATLR